MDEKRSLHPSFGYLTRDEVQELNAMPDGDTYRQRRRDLFNEADRITARAKRKAEKEATAPPWPDLKP